MGKVNNVITPNNMMPSNMMAYNQMPYREDSDSGSSIILILLFICLFCMILSIIIGGVYYFFSSNTSTTTTTNNNKEVYVDDERNDLELSLKEAEEDERIVASTEYDLLARQTAEERAAASEVERIATAVASTDAYFIKESQDAETAIERSQQLVDGLTQSQAAWDAYIVASNETYLNTPCSNLCMSKCKELTLVKNKCKNRKGTYRKCARWGGDHTGRRCIYTPIKTEKCFCTI
jgi:hypothetical protein